MLTVEEIEFKYNLEYTNEIKNKYGDIIIKIFNHENIDNDTDPQIKIIKAHYYIGNNAPFKGEQLLLELVDQNNVDGIYNLALYYYINEEYDKTMEYLKKGTDLNHINSSINLAYLYYIYKDYENFHKYNKIGIDNNNSMALIYNALYIWHVKKDEKTAILILEQIHNCEAYFTIAKLLNENNSLAHRYIIITNCINALKLKIKPVYINLLSEHTTTLQRYCLYKENNININLDIIKIDNYCPMCLKYKNLIQLICKHSICMDCIKKTNFNKCLICNELI